MSADVVRINTHIKALRNVGFGRDVFARRPAAEGTTGFFERYRRMRAAMGVCFLIPLACVGQAWMTRARST